MEIGWIYTMDLVVQLQISYSMDFTLQGSSYGACMYLAYV
jgi:hypothetical protein